MNFWCSPVDKDYHRGPIRPKMDEHHSKEVPLNQVVEARALLLQIVGAVDGVLLEAQVNGVKPVSRGVSKDNQNITRKMHMRTLFIMVCFFGIVVRSALEVMLFLNFKHGSVIKVSRGERSQKSLLLQN